MLLIKKEVKTENDFAIWLEQELNKILEHCKAKVELEPRSMKIRYSIVVRTKFEDNTTVMNYYGDIVWEDYSRALNIKSVFESLVSNKKIETNEEIARKILMNILKDFQKTLCDYFTTDCINI